MALKDETFNAMIRFRSTDGYEIPKEHARWLFRKFMQKFGQYFDNDFNVYYTFIQFLDEKDDGQTKESST